MKRIAPLVLFIAALSALSGYLMSKASLTGRVGISLFYNEYQFLKVWWQGALVVFAVLLVLMLVQGIVQRKLPKPKANILHVIMVLLALGGLYYTYNDFRHTLSHKLLGERFHIGGYLFWIGWIIISVFYIVQKRNDVVKV